MQELDRALGDIRSIRRQVAQSTEFRGYGPLTMAATAALALLTGVAQHVLFPGSAARPLEYVGLWTSTALLSVALIATQTLTRAHRVHSGFADEMIRMAAAQFAPSLLAGTLLTILLLRVAPQQAWLLPGLWQVLSSLGIFASCHSLPRPVAAVGVWYLITGLGCIALGEAAALTPEAMALPYAVGQSMFGAVLYRAAKGVPHAD